MPTVHILGAGAIGLLVAHELALVNARPTLLLRNKLRLDSFLALGSKLTVVRLPETGNSVPSTTHVAATTAPPPNAQFGIENLVLATKTYASVEALRPYVPHLHQNSNLLVLQNGMGTVEALREQYWAKSPAPHIYTAVTTHGAYKNDDTVHHVGIGHMTVALELDARPCAMVQLLLDSRLNAAYVPHAELLLAQMEKLVVNACLNPLTAVMDCYNGELLYGQRVVNVMKRIVRECVDVFHAEYGTQQMALANVVLELLRLLAVVLDVCQKTSRNSSSMREDVRQLRNTEIGWINGHVVRLGIKHKVATPANKMMVALVEDKLAIERGREAALSI